MLSVQLLRVIWEKIIGTRSLELHAAAGARGPLFVFPACTNLVLFEI